MSNTYFQFKQFRIEQGRTAMKVTTDACIQGAWTPVLPDVKRVLDIGAGTGLLSLMLAQKSLGTTIDAIELEHDAATQARENVSVSAWKDRINIIEGDVCRHTFTEKYDLIVSNPPFFNNSLLGDATGRNLARHTNSLSNNNLLKVITDNLHEDGYASILLPLAEYLTWKELLQNAGWIEFDKLSVRHKPEADVKRVITIFSKKHLTAINAVNLVIKNEQNNYTPEFIDLLSPYYLDL